MEFEFDGFTAEELVKYREWEQKQNFDHGVPGSIRVQHYNETLLPRSRYDLFCDLPTKATEYQNHIARSRFGGLVPAYPKAEREGRYDGYWKQPRKVYENEDEQFVYDWRYDQQAAASQT